MSEKGIRDGDRKVAFVLHFDQKRVEGALKELEGKSQNTFESKVLAIEMDANWGNSHESLQKRVFLAGSVWIEIFRFEDLANAEKKRLLRRAERFINELVQEYPIKDDLKELRRLIAHYRSGHGHKPMSDRSQKVAVSAEENDKAPPPDVPPAA